jgi:hypothetical protein
MALNSSKTSMEYDLYQANDYRKWLSKSFGARWGWGARTKLSHHLNCESTFVSRVFGLKAHFATHHLLVAARILKVSESDKRFLLLLYEKNRASHTEVHGYYKNQIELALKEHQTISKRIKHEGDRNKSTLDGESGIYYSAWYYSAIHMLLLNPEFRTSKSIAKRLQLSEVCVDSVLLYLVNHSYVEKLSGESYRVLKSRVHVGVHSPFVLTHHQNWKIKSAQTLHDTEDVPLRYSGPMSVSKEAIEEIKRSWLDTISRMESTISNAKDEELWAISLDLFRC